MIPSKPSERLEYFKKNKFKNEEILPYLIDHVKKFKKMNPGLKPGRHNYKDCNHPVLSPILGEIIFILIEKIVCGPKFKGYTEDWKMDFKSNAYLLLCKYIHNFNPKKTTAMKYLYNAIENAMFQELNLANEHTERFPECSIESFSVNYDQNSFDGQADTVKYLPEPLVTHQVHQLV